MGNFYSFCVFLHKFYAVLTTFWQISAKTHEMLASLMLLVAGVTVVACVTALACIQTVVGILAVADGFLMLVSLLLLIFLV
jgi:hypothetical protein